MNTNYIINYKKAVFGSYPQTIIFDNELIEKLNKLAGELPSFMHNHQWKSYNYYYAGIMIDYMWYQDIILDDVKYRGVYFNRYRSSNIYSAHKSDYLQFEYGFFQEKTYWFKFDPLVWDVLTAYDNKYLLISHDIIDSQSFNVGSDNQKYSHNNGIGYSNNYALSDIRRWLNIDFYKTAFTKVEREAINKTLVKNDISSTDGVDVNLVCPNTLDKIFLLSFTEVSTYYNNNFERSAKGTTYAQSQGLYESLKSTSCGNSFWWLRSPLGRNTTCSYRVGPDGTYRILQAGVSSMYSQVYRTNTGIRPALWVDENIFNEESEKINE